MSRDLGRPWWDFDPDERPVPLTEEDVAVALEAERIVQAERQAMIRQARDFRESPLDRLVSVRTIALLLAVCLVMFALGWKQGASASTGTQHSGGGLEAGHVTGTTSGEGPNRSTEGWVGNQNRRLRDEEVSTR